MIEGGWWGLGGILEFKGGGERGKKNWKVLKWDRRVLKGFLLSRREEFL
jgi:hypothetical protein